MSENKYLCPVCNWAYDPVEWDGHTEVPGHNFPPCDGEGKRPMIPVPESNTQQDKDRQAFEEWYDAVIPNRTGPRYANDATNIQWNAWQAAMEYARKEQLEELRRIRSKPHHGANDYGGAYGN